MTMYQVYSNLRACVDDMGASGDSDMAIALWALRNHEAIPSMGIADIARACGVSTATVSRFCRRVNGTDFHTFQQQIADYSAWLSSESSSRRAGDRVDLGWYFDSVIDAVEETRSLLREEDLEQAVDWLMDAQAVYLYGSSFSNVRAGEAADKLGRLNRLCFSFTNMRAQFESTELIRPEDVVVFISFSGRNANIGNLYRKIKPRGCRIIWISSLASLNRANATSELLLHVSDVSLREYETSLVEGLSLQCAIDALFMTYANRLRAQEETASNGGPCAKLTVCGAL